MAGNGRTQSLEERYAEPSFLEIETNMPVFKKQESSVRRRYSDFCWLRDELSRETKIVIPPLPDKALSRQLPWVSEKEGLFNEEFIEERRAGLEAFISKVASHPLAQNEKCLHMFLQEASINKDTYTPGKIARK